MAATTSLPASLSTSLSASPALPGATDILIIGAGLSGLAAATRLRESGRAVMVLDKGRGVGGRMATRRFGEGVFDHGAQFMTVRSGRFAAAMQGWTQAGVAREWCRGFGAEGDGHARFRGAPGMSAIPKHLAARLEIFLRAEVCAVVRDGGEWVTALKGGATIRSRAVILTAPVPQALALLEAGAFSLPDAWGERLRAIEYERCLAVMALLQSASQLLPPGVKIPDEGPITWIADNQQKGISPVPGITLHASDAFSRAHWEGDRTAAGAELLELAAPWIGAPVREFQVHGWKFSKPIVGCEEPCAVVHSAPGLILAGDAFGAAKVEGAALSGWAAAEALLAAD